MEWLDVVQQVIWHKEDDYKKCILKITRIK